jgi:hypothetical protein
LSLKDKPFSDPNQRIVEAVVPCCTPSPNLNVRVIHTRLCIPSIDMETNNGEISITPAVRRALDEREFN